MGDPRRLFGRSGADPGAAWAEELLSPLRRETITCDVAPRVMGRIARRRGIAMPAPSTRGPRLVWASSLFLGFACVAFLVSMLVVLLSGGDEGLRALWTMVEPAGRLAALAGHYVMKAITAAGAATVAIVRSGWFLVETAAPYFRGAGLLAAAWGFLSIIISTYLFAHARRTAPVIGMKNNATLQGGTR